MVQGMPEDNSIAIRILTIEVRERLKGYEAKVIVHDPHGKKKTFRIGVCSTDMFLERIRHYLRYQEE